MQVKEKPVTTAGIWSQTWRLFATLKKPYLQIGFFALFLPATILSFLFASWSQPLAEQVKSLARQTLAPGERVSYQQLVALMTDFLGAYLICGFLFVLLAAAVFFALVRLAMAAHADERLPAREALSEGLRFLFPRGLGLLVLLGLASLEQVLFGPFHVFTLFALMTPVISVAENRGLFASFKSAVLFRYSSPARGGGFATSFVLLTLSALLLTMQSVAAMGRAFILHADQWLGLPRGLWVMLIPGLPFGPMYALAQILSLALQVAGFSFLACFMVSLFYTVRPQISHRI